MAERLTTSPLDTLPQGPLGLILGNLDGKTLAQVEQASKSLKQAGKTHETREQKADKARGQAKHLKGKASSLSDNQIFVIISATSLLLIGAYGGIPLTAIGAGSSTPMVISGCLSLSLGLSGAGGTALLGCYLNNKEKRLIEEAKRLEQEADSLTQPQPPAAEKSGDG